MSCKNISDKLCIIIINLLPLQKSVNHSYKPLFKKRTLKERNSNPSSVSKSNAHHKQQDGKVPSDSHNNLWKFNPE